MLSNEIDQFITDRKARNVTAGSIKFYQMKLGVFRNYCEAAGVDAVADVDANLLRSFILWLKDEGHSDGGVLTFWRSVRAFINWAENEFDIEWRRSPVRKVRAPKVPDEILEPITIEAIEALLATCDQSKFTGARDFALILTMADSGARIAELLDLQLDDYDTADNSLTIQKGKGGKGRITFVGRRTAKAITKWLEFRGPKAGPLFVKHPTRGGGPLVYGSVREVFRVRSKRAGLPRQATPHSFRRFFGISAITSGLSNRIVQELMGHESPAMVQRYSKFNRTLLGKVYRSPIDGE